MTPTDPRPLWGWTAPARAWLTIIGASLALGLIVGSRTTVAPPAPAPHLVVDPNTAPPEVLNALPRLGPTLVRRIVEARDEAPFRSLDDLDARVRGIGPTTLAALRPHLQTRIRSERSGSGSPPIGADGDLAPRRALP